MKLEQNDTTMMRLCGGEWIYCNGKCNECQEMAYTATSITEEMSDRPSYSNHT